MSLGKAYHLLSKKFRKRNKQRPKDGTGIRQILPPVFSPHI